MKKKLLALSLALAFTSTSGILHAESSINAGKEKAESCVSCHGEHGNSLVSTFPKLAGQNPSYFTKQLEAFKNGTRKNPLMNAIAAGLSPKDISNLAAYYAKQEISANTLSILDDDEEEAEKTAGKKETIQDLIAQGSDLYRNGDLAREVSACIACHGPLGEGNKPAAFPAIRSQHADYLIQTLTDFKNDTRRRNQCFVISFHDLFHFARDE